MSATDHEMRLVLARLELVSHGSTQNFTPTGGGAHESSPPSGESSPPHLLYRKLYLGARDDVARRGVLRAALAELERITGRNQPARPQGENEQERQERILRQTAGWAPADVERSSHRVSARVLRRMRVADGRDPETGRKVTGEQADADPADRARELKTKGLSVRAIALVLGKQPKQIQRYLERAA